ncbi:cyclin-D1-2-like isoform X1 [Dendrobium catenatum]|uniref:cyclin-D1-2-like isoform X1 n=1 Tax=Dendrobium catenatum TaxID=906689 RepID=UPI00109F3E15|nr:cyclin-D1-2-like isoform X1 [Dendrobium catenatum]
MEETHVPVLLDLQILDSKYVFEPRTICRMELLILTVLTWRMRAVTPFDFLPYLAASVLPVDSTAILSRATNLIISSRRDSLEAVVDFLRFRPSTIAAAAMLCASVKIAAPSASDNAVCFSYFSEWNNKDVVGECRQLMEEYLIDACPSESPPSHSPVGTVTAAARISCNVEKSSAGVVKAEPPSLKRRRLVDGECG